MNDNRSVRDILNELVRMIGELSARVARLEDRTAAPVLYPSAPTFPLEAGSHCRACGLDLKPVMGYVCTRNPCPTGLGGPTC